MKQTRIFGIFLMILVFFSVLIGATAAQDVDVNAMSNEELMVLLQSIMQKLEQEMGTEATEKGPDAVDTAVQTEAGSPVQETEAEIEKISVYGNKKMVVESLPAYMFVRKPIGGGDEGAKSGGTRRFEFHYGDYVFFVDIPEDSLEDAEYGIPTDIWNAW